MCLNVKEILAQSKCKMWSLSDCILPRFHNHLANQRKLNHLFEQAKSLSCVLSIYLYGAFTCMFMSCQVAFKSKPTFYRCLNVKELLPRSMHEIWSLNDSNWTQTHSLLFYERKHNRLAQLAKRLSCVVSTYLYGAFDYMFLSCHARVSDSIHIP